MSEDFLKFKKNFLSTLNQIKISQCSSERFNFSESQFFCFIIWVKPSFGALIISASNIAAFLRSLIWKDVEQFQSIM